MTVGAADTRRSASVRRAALSAWMHGWWTAVRFGGSALVVSLSPSAYNAATRAVTSKQVYFTAWEVLPGFCAFMVLFGAIFVRIVAGTAEDLGLAGYAPELVLRVLVLEVVPLSAALLVALRSGSAISTEVALMQAEHELEALRHYGVDPMRFELAPRVVGAVLAVTSLTVINCALTLVVAYLGVYGASLWALPEFTRVVGEVFDPRVAMGFGLKALGFGVAVAVIPISAGIAAERGADAVPVAVLRGMMKLFFALAVIEVASLTATYI